MMSACFKLKKLLLGSFLSAPPNPPTSFRAVPRSDGLDLSWTPGLTTSAYNTDTFEVEMTPDAPELRAVLGDAFGSYVNFYAGAEPACTVDNLRPEQSFSVRVRCRNAAGASPWVGARVTTCQVPVNCGGTGPHGTYVWDQTPTHVEVRVPAPPGLVPRGVAVAVKPRRLEVRLDGVVAVAGALTGEVLCQEDGDFEWELRDVPGDGNGDGAREVFITLEKRVVDCVKYDPMEQWDRLLDEEGHARIDRTRLRWFRDEAWRPPQDARNPDEVAKALPGMRMLDRDQTKVGGRDGELDDWGREWRKPNAA